MDFLWTIDWQRLFVPEMTLPEILIRGTLIYLALCILLRVVLRRQAGKVALSDLLVISIVAGVCRNPLVRDAYSVTDGVLVVATVLAWGYALGWLSYYVPFVHAMLHAPPVQLIRDGEVLHENLRHELMTEGRLYSKLRGKGLREPAEAAEAWMEGNGKVSVIKKPKPPPEPARDSRNGTTSDADAEVRAFLEAAEKLEARIARHQDAIARHERGIAEVKEALARFGVRWKTAASRRPGKRSAHGQGDVNGSV